MNNQDKLKKELSWGRLIWMQPPSGGSGSFFIKKLLTSMGYRNSEILFLTARQFMRYALFGFSKEFLSERRVILIGGLDDLPHQNRQEFLKKLSLYKVLKVKFDVNLILISPAYLDLVAELNAELQPSVFQLMEEGDPIGINERIHDLIEKTAKRQGKVIHRLSLSAAETLEATLLLKGEDYLKGLLGYSIRHCEGSELLGTDLDRARQFIESFGIKNLNHSL